MRPVCNLEIQVNGQHTFYVRKKVLLARCGRLVKVFQKAVASSLLQIKPKTGRSLASRFRSYRAILHDLPGGSAAFELVARFCYNGGNVQITTWNVAMLRCVAEFMEMTEEYGKENLVKQTEAFLSNMTSWSFEEILIVLKSCEPLIPFTDHRRIVQRCVSLLAVKTPLRIVDSCRLYSSPDSIVDRSSPDIKNEESASPRSCWSEDVLSLSMYLMEQVVNAMMANNVDNKLLAKFLLHYLQESLHKLGYSSVSSRKTWDPDHEILCSTTYKIQREVLEMIVDLLYSLERTSISCRSMFSLQRMAIVLNACKYCRKQLEELIGSQLDKATLDNILIRAAPSRDNPIFDVDLILRLVIAFLENQSFSPSLECLQITSSCSQTSSQSSSLKKVGNLIDLYLVEIAPDPNLKPSKFKALAQALPDDARDSHDRLYRALDIYLEAHPRLTDIEAMELCKIVNFQKLSLEACKHVAQNPRFPARLALQVLLLQQQRLRVVVENGLINAGSINYKSRRDFSEEDETTEIRDVIAWSPAYNSVVRQNDELKSDLQKMESRVIELENNCRRMKSEMAKNTKTHRFLC